MTNHEIRHITLESLRDWFKKEKWVRITTSGNIAGPCGTSKNKKNPDRCLPAAKARSLTKAQRAATARKKKKAGAKGKTVVKNTKAATVKKESQLAEKRAYKILSPKDQAANDAKFDKRMSTLKDLKKGQRLHKAGKISDEDLHNLKVKAGVVSAVKKEGLWANINAKKKAGKKSSHKNSNAYKDAKKAGNALKQETANPQDGKAAPYGSGYKPIKKMKEEKNINKSQIEKLKDMIKSLKKSSKGHAGQADYLGKLINNETKGAPAGHYFTKSGNLVKGRLTKDARERGARLSDPKDKQRSKVPPVTQTREDVRNLVVGLIHEIQNEGTIEEKDDRCTRIAKRKYDTWPSAYASGAVVRCRRGEIWKGVSEDSLNELKCKHGSYFCPHDKVMKCRKGPKKSRS
tara:strand:- start:5353 stop:6561 length:1209 start_codon:yes stop_codon:yes gene_type:complete